MNIKAIYNVKGFFFPFRWQHFFRTGPLPADSGKSRNIIMDIAAKSMIWAKFNVDKITTYVPL